MNRLKFISNLALAQHPSKLNSWNIRNIKISPSSGIFTSLIKCSNEQQLISTLKEKFPKASTVEVQDVSGGCGSMFEVWVESIDFKGLSRVKQHKLITQALKEEIKDMHGLRISTSIPENS